MGDAVEADEPLLEVSTDKVDSEVPSPVAGTIVEAYAWAPVPLVRRFSLRALKPLRFSSSLLKTLTTFCPAIISST